MLRQSYGGDSGRAIEPILGDSERCLVYSEGVIHCDDFSQSKNPIYTGEMFLLKILTISFADIAAV